MLDQVKMFTLLFGVFFSFGRVGGQVRCGQRQAGTTVQEVPGNAVAGVPLWPCGSRTGPVFLYRESQVYSFPCTKQLP